LPESRRVTRRRSCRQLAKFELDVVQIAAAGPACRRSAPDHDVDRRRGSRSARCGRWRGGRPRHGAASTRSAYDALNEASASCSRLPAPQHPDHHFTFDPQKLISYTATALAWLGDGARAEPFAREVINLRQREGRPRRVATARIDLALILARHDRPEEACDLGQLALVSGRLVRSNIWRAAELDEALSRRSDAPEVRMFHERYLNVRDRIAAR
jgi:hypothetical protein